jgi:transposase
MIPTKEQLIELKRCFLACRLAFNFANKRVRDDKMSANTIALRKEWVCFEKPDEIKGIASRFTSNAIKDLVEAYKSNFARLRKDPKHKFQIRDRSEIQTRTEVMHVERQGMLLGVVSIDSSSASKRRAECGLAFGNNLQQHGMIRIQGKRNVIDMVVSTGTKLHAAAKIQWDKQANAFYFIWVRDQVVSPDPDPTFQKKRIVALDPGSAPFQQWYSPTSGECGELLSGAREDLKARCLKIDKIRQRIDRRKKHPENGQPKRFQRYSKKKQKNKRQRTTRVLWQKLRRESKRLSRNVEAAHYDAANFLLERHEIIIAPVLQTVRLTEKTSKVCFGSKLARALYTWGHRLFRQRLAYAAVRYPGRYVFECCEPGTSKTCTNCGAWKHNLRLGDKVYNCSHCKTSVDRQLAGARNNFFAAYGMAIGMGWDGMSG